MCVKLWDRGLNRVGCRDGNVVVSISPKASERHPELFNTGQFYTAPVTRGNQGGGCDGTRICSALHVCVTALPLL